MSIQTIPTPPMTQKSQRKAAAADVNDRTMFKRTEFGRKRIASFPVRLIRGVISLPISLFVFLRCLPCDAKPRVWEREG